VSAEPRCTLSAPQRFELVVKRSRFLARACPVPSPERAMERLAELSDRQATHNCWAWRVGELYRSCDDGEPGGSAGRPILAAIDGRGLDRVLLVVTRWFGGTKLGVGGLVRAYGGAAAECLRCAATQPIVQRARVRLRAGFGDLGAVYSVIERSALLKEAESFCEEGVVLVISCPRQELPELARSLAHLTRGRVAPEPLVDGI